jgi:branched-chain amino acid transport system substrate-binding protein
MVIALVVLLAFPIVSWASEVLKIGGHATLTGPAAGWYIPMLHAAEIFSEDVEAAGGLRIGGKTYMLKTYAYDNKYTSAGGTAAATKLVYEDKAKFLFISTGSASVLASQAITEPAKVLSMTPAWDKGIVKEFTFRMAFSGVEMTTPLAFYVRKRWPQAKTVAVAYPNDPTGWEPGDWEIKCLKANGFEIVTKELYERGTTDFYPVATKLMAKKPDMISLGSGSPGEVALIWKSLYELGWRGIKFNPGQISSPAIIKTGGPGMNGVLICMGFDPAGPFGTAKGKELSAKMKKHGWENESMWAAAVGWFSLEALTNAMRAANSIDSVKVKEAMQDLKWDSIFGPARFGMEDYYGFKRQCLYNNVVTEVIDGKPVDIAAQSAEEMLEMVEKVRKF